MSEELFLAIWILVGAILIVITTVMTERDNPNKFAIFCICIFWPVPLAIALFFSPWLLAEAIGLAIRKILRKD